MAEIQEIQDEIQVEIEDPIFKPRMESAAFRIPYEFSWDKVEPPIFLSEIRKQHGCACCWCIVAAGCIEAIYNITKIKTPREMIEVSPQSFLENVPMKIGEHFDARGCFPACVERAFAFAMECGFVEERTCPYKACRSREISEFYRFGYIREYVFIGDYESVIDRLKIQPVAAVICVTENFSSLKEEIYMGPSRKEMMILRGNKNLHAVLVIGHGADVTGRKYFIIRNSMGKDWGVEGIGKVSMDSVRYLGSDYFLLDRFCYPLL